MDFPGERLRELDTRTAVGAGPHHLSNLDNLALGVAAARRAWIAPSQVLNARPASERLGRGATETLGVKRAPAWA